MSIAVFWFRRDLRLEDNHGLYQALKQNSDVLPLFIFDKAILKELVDKRDRRVDFIHWSLKDLDAKIKAAGGSGLLVVYGEVTDCWRHILETYKPASVYCNHDYEPQAISRDLKIDELCSEYEINFYSYKDQVIFEEDEVLKSDGSPYTVYTPYSKVWKAKLKETELEPFHSENWLKNFTRVKIKALPTLEDIGFLETDLQIPTTVLNHSLLKDYHKFRDIPGLDATSRQSIHLRFGTISVRQTVKKALKINSTFLNELIWREFFMMILYHFPKSVSKEFREKYSGVQWRYDEEDFKKWCFGQTGYPIVDAGMRELNATGFMHNRVRMITASFLVKHLMIDWRWGERYFAKKLLDFDLSANVGNWQWAAGTGCDAAPYFRIFNPYTQTEKFDKSRDYIKKWVPEYESTEYPNPIIDHKVARERALKTYKEGII